MLLYIITLLAYKLVFILVNVISLSTLKSRIHSRIDLVIISNDSVSVVWETVQGRL